MSNHFHYSIQVKAIDIIVNYIVGLPKSRVSKCMAALVTFIDEDEQLINERVNSLILTQFQSFFNGYAKAINKKYNRVGSLFQKGFKRSLYNPDIKFQYLQYYIHHNARKHGFVNKFLDYPHHSYYDIIDGNSRYIDVNEVLKYFDSIDEFIAFHNSVQYEDKFETIDLDEFL